MKPLEVKKMPEDLEVPTYEDKLPENIAPEMLKRQWMMFIMSILDVGDLERFEEGYISMDEQRSIAIRTALGFPMSVGEYQEGTEPAKSLSRDNFDLLKVARALIKQPVEPIRSWLTVAPERGMSSGTLVFRFTLRVGGEVVDLRVNAVVLHESKFYRAALAVVFPENKA